MSNTEGEQPQRIPGLPPSEAAAAHDAGQFSNEAAAAEEKVLSSGKSASEIAEKSRLAEHDRNERFRDHFEWIVVKALYVTAFAFLAISATWFWHVITPYHWLEPDQLARLQSFVTGGVIVGIATGHLKKRLGQ